MSKIVYTAGYPRSGNTWLNRLLSDLLDSPMTIIKGTPVIRRFCQTGKGGYLIKKTHWQNKQWPGEDKLIYIVRDPRDVSVSQLFYRGLQPENDTLEKVINGLRQVDDNRIGYGLYVRQWMNDGRVMHTSYELLHQQLEIELQRFSNFIMNERQSPQRLKAIKERQAFAKWKPQFQKSMRKGVVGDWTNYYTRKHGELIDSFLGDTMLDLGYIQSRDWWKNLPT